MDLKKMFNAIVASGFTIASTGAATTVCSGCGGEGVPVRDAGADAGFPREGSDAGLLFDAGPQDAGFPREGPAPMDAGPEDAGFPREGIDGGFDFDAGASDAGASDAGVDAGFPREGPALADAGS